MNWIDTHAHIYQEDFLHDIDSVMDHACEAGIKRILLPNIDRNSIEIMHQLCDQYPSICYPMMGIHPASIGLSFQEDLSVIRNYFEIRKYIAVGEIGIDLYWDKTFLKEQIHAFETQLQWSVDMQLPVVIHNRDAFPYVFESLNKVGISNLKGVFHSFGGTLDELKQILSLDNFMIGINGVVTFKNSNLSAYLDIAPLEKILIETDAPYLSPVPFRGKRNEPAYMLNTAVKLSEIYGVSLEEIARKTTKNAISIFNLCK